RSAIDLRVLREAAAVAETSPATTPLRVYAPIGASLLDDVYVEQYVWEIADATGLSAGQMHLMVDRALVADGHPKTRHTLQSLRDNGCSLVVMDIDESSDVEAMVRDCNAVEVRLAGDAIGRSLRDRASGAVLERVVAAAHLAGARVISPGVATGEGLRA